jgi:AraC-like DNA-binding protein
MSFPTIHTFLRAAPRQRPGVPDAKWIPSMGGFPLLRGRFEGSSRPHMHPWYVLAIVDHGTVVISHGGRPWIAGVGNLVVLAPFEAHSEQAVDGRPWAWRCIYLDLDSSGGLGRRSRYLAPAPVVQDRSYGDELSRVFDVLWWRGSEPRIDRRLVQLCHSLFHYSPRETAHHSTAVVRAWLHKAPPGAMRTADLAKLAGLSPSHLIRTFHRDVGRPPYAYYRLARIARAEQLLWQGSSFSDIAFGLGFSDQSHFCRDFKRGTGFTPGQYAAMVHDASVRTPSGPGAWGGSCGNRAGAREAAVQVAAARLRLRTAGVRRDRRPWDNPAPCTSSG